ncbi:hypothetical protein RDABS01_027679, partial [Bienertia sinuspersici]
IKVMQRQYDGPWPIVLKGDRGYQNHELLVYNEGHRQVSGLSPGAKKLVRDMTEARAKPGPILAAVKERFPNLNPNKRHIYNFRAKLREEKAEGQNPAEQFLYLIVKHKYLFWIDSDEGVVTHTFVAHPTSVNLLRTFPFVIMMDSTYKTNRYDMPLFEIIGMSSTNKNFLNGWALMKDETEESYRWVMERAVYFDIFQEACAPIDWGGEWCVVMCFAVRDDGLNPNIPVTVLPWDAEPTLTRPTTELTIAQLGSYKHFIRLELDDDFLVPLISPI